MPSYFSTYIYLSRDMTKPTKWVCAQRRLWSDWADTQADLSLRWAHSHIVGFVMSWLIFSPRVSFPAHPHGHFFRRLVLLVLTVPVSLCIIWIPITTTMPSSLKSFLSPWTTYSHNLSLTGLKKYVISNGRPENSYQRRSCMQTFGSRCTSLISKIVQQCEIVSYINKCLFVEFGRYDAEFNVHIHIPTFVYAKFQQNSISSSGGVAKTVKIKDDCRRGHICWRTTTIFGRTQLYY